MLIQSFPDWELVVIDDGSKDDTAKIARSFAQNDPRIRVVRQENGGIASARNRGFATTCGASEYVVFLDHDDIWEPDTLETLLAAIEEAPDSPAVYGISRFIDQSGQPHLPGWLENWHQERHEMRKGRLIPLSPRDRTTFASEIYENRISTMGQVLIRRSSLELLSPLFNPDTVPCDDWDLYLRLALLGDLVYLPKVVLGRRIHGNNVSSNQQAMERKEDFIRDVYASSRALSAENRRIAKDAYRAWYKEAYAQRISWVKGCLRERKILAAAKQARHAVRLLLRILLPGRGTKRVHEDQHRHSSI